MIIWNILDIKSIMPQSQSMILDIFAFSYIFNSLQTCIQTLEGRNRSRYSTFVNMGRKENQWHNHYHATLAGTHAIHLAMTARWPCSPDPHLLYLQLGRCSNHRDRDHCWSGYPKLVSDFKFACLTLLTARWDLLMQMYHWYPCPQDPSVSWSYKPIRTSSFHCWSHVILKLTCVRLNQTSANLQGWFSRLYFAKQVNHSCTSQQELSDDVF